MIQVKAISAIAHPRQNENPLRYRGASTVGNVNNGVQAVEDCESRLISTSVKLRSSGLSRSRLLTQPWKTLDSAFDQYIVAKPNHSAPSGTVQAVKTARPTALKTEHMVIAHAGPRYISEAKQANSVYPIPRAGAIVPNSLIFATLNL